MFFQHATSELSQQGLTQYAISAHEVNVHCSPAKEVFFHNSQLDNERLLEKSQNPREIRTCSLPIARHKR